MRRRLATFGGIAIPAPAGVAALWLAGSFSESPITFLMAALLNLVLFTPWLLVQFRQALPATMRALDARLATRLRRRGASRQLRTAVAIASGRRGRLR